MAVIVFSKNLDKALTYIITDWIVREYKCEVRLLWKSSGDVYVEFTKAKGLPSGGTYIQAICEMVTKDCYTVKIISDCDLSFIAENKS